MTHPLKTKISGAQPSLFPQTVGRPYAAVVVENTGKKKLAIQLGQIQVMKHDAYVVMLPDDFKVINPEDGTVIDAEHTFWITTETFDPYHAVIDWDGKKESS